MTHRHGLVIRNIQLDFILRALNRPIRGPSFPAFAGMTRRRDVNVAAPVLQRTKPAPVLHATVTASRPSVERSLAGQEAFAYHPFGSKL
jgi:hypothetical protein